MVWKWTCTDTERQHTLQFKWQSDRATNYSDDSKKMFHFDSMRKCSIRKCSIRKWSTRKCSISIRWGQEKQAIHSKQTYHLKQEKWTNSCWQYRTFNPPLLSRCAQSSIPRNNYLIDTRNNYLIDKDSTSRIIIYRAYQKKKKRRNTSQTIRRKYLS